MGAIGLLSLAVISSKYPLFLSMVGVGVAWASILSLPYSILAGALPPDKTGTYLGIFNFFIVIPEILAALVFGKIMETLLTNESVLVQLLGGDNRLTAVVIGGISLAVAAALCSIVIEPAACPSPKPRPAGKELISQL
jgi:maltose/moltooligosaccharide transporter